MPERGIPRYRLSRLAQSRSRPGVRWRVRRCCGGPMAWRHRSWCRTVSGSCRCRTPEQAPGGPALSPAGRGPGVGGGPGEGDEGLRPKAKRRVERGRALEVRPGRSGCSRYLPTEGGRLASGWPAALPKRCARRPHDGEGESDSARASAEDHGNRASWALGSVRTTELPRGPAVVRRLSRDHPIRNPVRPDRPRDR